LEKKGKKKQKQNKGWEAGEVGWGIERGVFSAFKKGEKRDRGEKKNQKTERKMARGRPWALCGSKRRDPKPKQKYQ